MKKEFEFKEVYQICTEHQIEIKDLKSISGSFGKKIYFINQEYLLRVSEISMTLEQEKFRRIAALNNVPKIIHTGILKREADSIYYTLLTLLPGDDFVNVYSEITKVQQKQLGEDIAGFLDNLQEMNGTHYDIGLYVPALPHFSGTWREGHQKYWERLKQASEKLPLKPDSIQVFKRAYGYLQATSAVLDFQTGPRLLHNDFHPRNILLYQGKFSGVIDWECSQFGEADFELCHFIHWCLYPPKPNIDFRTFLRAFFKASPKCTQVPNLAQRLTIYQIEHEMQQIIWNASEAESLRVPRLVRWMDGCVDGLFREIAI
ncbi:MAG TPA: aminoglycoside phosphotransferase family protein [Anaerovoracaceae bacterium]|nr:aminoglycoside phosphotransferase family protein [Anaerovoracaceae bacterium]